MGEMPKPKNSLAEGLLREETIDESQYKEYRMNLELALNRAQRFERIVFRVCWISLVLSLGLSFVGGTRVVGSFDPYSPAANALSITLGVVYVLASIVFPWSLVAYYFRFRRRIRELKHEITETKIDELQREVENLRGEVEKLRGQGGE